MLSTLILVAIGFVAGFAAGLWLHGKVERKSLW